MTPNPTVPVPPAPVENVGNSVDTWSDVGARFGWTVVSAAGGALAGAALFDVAVWKMAASAGLTAAVNFVTLLARKKLGTNT